MPRAKQTARKGFLNKPPAPDIVGDVVVTPVEPPNIVGDVTVTPLGGDNRFSHMPMGGFTGENPYSKIPLGGFPDPAAAAAQQALLAKRDSIMAQPRSAAPPAGLGYLTREPAIASLPRGAGLERGAQRLMGISDAVAELRKPSIVETMAKAAGYMRRKDKKK